MLKAFESQLKSQFCFWRALTIANNYIFITRIWIICRWLWLSNYIIAYDADCVPCARFKHIVNLLDVSQIIDFISLKEADKSGLLDQIPQSIRFKSFHLLGLNGDISSGPDALVDLIAILPLGHGISKLLLSVPIGRQMIRHLYLIFSRLHDKGSCHFEAKRTRNSPTKLQR